jgi:hypothetical protein
MQILLSGNDCFLCATEFHSRPLKFGKVFVEFLNLNELVFSHACESLPGIAGGPPDFQTHNLRGFS